ncbi:MAG: hypothetical protein H6608_05005 [Flavobacteriales bacterium]|nr:hypothetical protein [Bacteroidota bacterium]MCB9240463.1 hypothetical protein [Flavobacteriales bacterium]
MHTFQKLLLALALIAGISCNPRNTSIPAYHPDFVHHISAYTSGYVERDAIIKVVLTKPVSPKDQEKVLKNELFRFEPELEGETQFESSTVVTFTPSKTLPRNTIYQGVFHLGAVAKVESNLKRFPLRFETRQQRIDLEVHASETYSDNNPVYRYLTGYVNLADVEYRKDMEKCLTVSINRKEYPVRWYDQRGTRFSFRIDSLKRQKEGVDVVLKVNGKPIESKDDYFRIVHLHGLGDFKLADVSITNEPDQVIDLFFSESISVTQSLKGLIQLDSQEVQTMEMQGNKITIYPTNRLIGVHTVQLSGEIKSILGYPLTTSLNREIHFDRPKPKLKMIGTGTIVPNARGVVFPFEAMALKAVDVYIYQIHADNIPQFMQVNELAEADQLKRVGTLLYSGKVSLNSAKKSDPNQWERYTLDIGKYINREPGAIYRVMIGFRKSYTYFICDEDDGDYESDNDALYYSYYSGGDYYLKNYDPCDASFYYSTAIARNILASDIGLMVKSGTDGKLHVFAQDLVSSEPLNNVQIDVLNYQNQKLKSSVTNEQGMTTLSFGEEPYLLIARNGSQHGYLKLRSGLSKSTSRFDVDGIREENGVQGMIYAERGVWRPGDSIYTCFILRDKNHTLPANVPVTAILTNPRGTEVFKKVLTKSVGGMYDFRTATTEEAETGNYRMKISVGESSYFKTLPVETVQPNRLKIRLTAEDSVLKVKNNRVKIEASWLHGAPSPGLNYTVQANIRAVPTHFEGYNQFVFDDATKSFSAQDQIVARSVLDPFGADTIKPGFAFNQLAPGKLKVDFIAKVFEKSGAFSTDYATYDLSTYGSYAGIGTPKSMEDDGSFITDKDHVFPLVHLSEDGKPISGKLDVKIYRIEWRWWWESHRNLANYIQSNTLIPIVNEQIKTSNGAGEVRFSLAYPNWGQFLMVARDPSSGHSASKVFYVDWPYWRRVNRNTSDDAVVLRLATDKTAYSVGSKINVSIPSGGAGMALVSVENGSSVLKKFWVKTTEKETRVTITATADMAPNAYVHVSFIQPYNQTSNDLPVRTYGIVPIRVEDPGTKLNPIITMADEIRPDRKNRITIREKHGKDMNYTLAVVDEGLLDITHFKTPDPRSQFNKKRGLGVRTWDVYDDVMGAYKGKWANVLSVGGDGEGEAAETKHRVNRFVPAVRFLGPFHLKAGQTASHQIELGEYIGAVRVMVVASSGMAQGSAEKSVKVKKPIMLLTTLPRVLTPGERIAIPVTVFNTENVKRRIDVKVKLKGAWKLNADAEKEIVFNGIGEEVIPFWATVEEAIGEATAIVTISDGTETMTSTTHLIIRTPNNEITESQEYVLKPGESKTIKTVMNGIDGTNNLVLEASGLPPINLEQRVRELIMYPHGCVEQTTSSVFAQLFLSDFIRLSSEDKAEVSRNVQAGVDRLRRFQTSSGGLAYWPGNSHASDWGTNYAGHFITLAKEYGFYVDATFYANWVQYQQEAARNFNTSSGNDHLIQAYRLYTLALAGSADIASMNRLRENNLQPQTKWRLAAAYSMAGMPEVANALVKNITSATGPYNTHGNTYGSAMRDQALILETMVLMGQQEDGFHLIKDISQKLASRSWLSTQETAYSLIALASYHRTFKQTKESAFNYTANGKNIPVRFSTPYANMRLHLQATSKTDETTVKNTGKGLLFVRMIKTGVPTQMDTVQVAQTLRLTVQYTDYLGKVVDVSQVKQGQELKILVKLTNDGKRGTVKDIAISHLIPGGWEIQNMRHVLGERSNGFDYRDVRDDRVYTYVGLSAGQSRSYEIPVTATYAGKYYLPNVRAEAMYDNTITASVPGKWIEVVQSGNHLK